MKVDVLTLFPDMFYGVIGSSMMKRAQDQGFVTIDITNFREFSQDRHHTVDDYPFGGGAGMVLKPDPIFRAVESLTIDATTKPRVILLTPQGVPFTQEKALELAGEPRMIMICGHYEGYDERVREHLVTDEISIGDYVLTSGELAAMVVMDAVVRLIPGVLGNEESTDTDSFSHGLLEFPQYTRPRDFRGWCVPDILLSGHHKNIAEWRHEQALYRTYTRRPDMIEILELSLADQQRIRKWKQGIDIPK
ncbi:MAG: tRNA (guanosine(37)-N1)-methyltransferase TrmD [Acidibacillus sp.]|uniref:tRNA (guanine-N(1)-)-methyltransferase n=1 Tax=Sulfoacidibacillus ferrooxidans TaxID=2005001 RepID=A0A9X2AF81_9BACL|nr:tRNA (guanine-N(1)-)-methyltransferase [Sulfoacidibacillus ferrooxidans]MCY0893009.1 tRNA (guanosine(37)-N1)-methyltransferase TrmD [Acidibacillus sp.]